MDYFIAGLLIVMVLIFFLFLKIVSSLTKAFMYFMLLMLIVLVFFGFFFGKDFVSFFRSMESEDKLFILKDNRTFITAFEMKKVNETSSVPKTRLDVYQDAYIDKEYDKILDGRYKVFFFELSGLEKENSTISSAIRGKNGIIEIAGEDVKNAAFILLVTKKEKEDPLYLIKGYQQGYIEIYPESLLFRVLRTGRK